MKNADIILTGIIFALFWCCSVNAAYLRIYCGSFDNYTSTELENPLPLLDSQCYNSSIPSVVYAFGFTEFPTGPDTTAIVNAYLTLNKYNIFVIDWEKEAYAPDDLLLQPPGYAFSAVPHAIEVGKRCGEALIKMTQKKFRIASAHLIGHSLGAHLMGYCGKTVQENGKNVSRITGLDPAGPLFDGTLSLDGLDPSRASYVDVHHTNPCQLGTDENLGSIDIWYNFINGSQPGCYSGKNDLEDFVNGASCSHRRSWVYYADALLNPTSYQALGVANYEDWTQQNKTYSSQKVIYIGDKVHKQARGNFFLSTNSAVPYGKGKAGLLSS